MGLEDYVNFDLHVTSSGQVYAKSEEGEVTSTISLDVPNSIRLGLGFIENGMTDQVSLKDFGEQLYDWLFPGPIHTHFQQTEATARSTSKKVRLRLQVEARPIARLPLEFLYRKMGGYFFAINPATVLSRYLNLAMPIGNFQPPRAPLDVLAIIANPSDQPSFNPGDSGNSFGKRFKKRNRSGSGQARTVMQATRREIRDALLRHKPDIVQFIGHGIYRRGKGYLALANENGTTWLLDDERFADLFMGFDDHLRLIELVACDSGKSGDPQGFRGVAPQLVERGIPAVIAMQYPVGIDTASVFLEELFTVCGGPQANRLGSSKG